MKGNPQESLSMASHRTPHAETTTFPLLPYNLRDHTKGIVTSVGIVLITSVIVNLAIFYGLWYGTTLKHNIVVAIPVSIFGGVTIPPFFIRLWKLTRKSDFSRPLNGARQFDLDFFQFSYLFGIIMVTVEIVIGTTPHEPYIRLLAMPACSLMFEVGTLIGLSLLLCTLNVKAPLRLSSVQRGMQVRPGVYTIIEDVVAVDGGGGRAYREALDARYEASPKFRSMLYTISLSWWLGLWILAGAITAIVMTVEETAAYGVGWAAPFVIVALMAIATTKYVQSSLRHELMVQV